jgi:DNA-binding transcriptional LysR family regulator
MDRWHALKAFMNVLELRSYTAAARKLALARSHRLRPLFKKYATSSLPLYAVHPSHRHLATKVRICVDFLVDWFDRRAE